MNKTCARNDLVYGKKTSHKRTDDMSIRIERERKRKEMNEKKNEGTG